MFLLMKKPFLDLRQWTPKFTQRRIPCRPMLPFRQIQAGAGIEPKCARMQNLDVRITLTPPDFQCQAKFLTGVKLFF
jgi:hypothetical protein